MNIKELKKLRAAERKIVGIVLNQYLEKNACPCNWTQFRYWVSKEQGPGWQDEIQNALVEIALELPIFLSEIPSNPEYGLAAEVCCEHCSTKWKHFKIEWRMLAFKEQLIPSNLHEEEFTNFPDQLVSESIFATAGREPHQSIQRLSISEWIDFMQGKH